MRTNYVLIDYENVQPTSLSLLNGHPFKVMVFVGANQTKVPLDLAKTLQPMGANADYVLISGNGRNALDFHITFYLGELSTKDPAGFFHLISKDTGFDPLVAHLKSRGIFAQRSADLREIPIHGFIAPESLEERVKAVIENLASRGSSRPRTTKNAHEHDPRAVPEETDAGRSRSDRRSGKKGWGGRRQRRQGQLQPWMNRDSPDPFSARLCKVRRSLRERLAANMRLW